MQSKATTVAQYLADLPDDRRRTVEAVRQVFLDNLDSDYEEGMQYGMIGYYVPHRVFPAGYHCDPRQPLPFAGLASQKNHLSLHLMCIYGEGDLATWFRQAWAKTGKKLDMGKACIRFNKVEDLALDVIAETIRRLPVKKYVAFFEAWVQANRERSVKGPPDKPRASKKAPARKKAKSAPRAKAKPAKPRKRPAGTR